MKAIDWKVGISTGCFEREMFEQYAEAGIDCMELSLGYLPAEIDWKSVQKYAEETKIELWSYHLPFGPFAEIDISSKDKEKRDHTVNLFSERIKSAADIGVRNIIIHASVEPIKDEDRESLIAIAGESLAKLSEIAKQSGSAIAVEDLPRTCLGNCAKDIKKLISYDDNLRVCLDTNHLLTEINTDFIKALGDKIVTTHISDYDFTDERHWMPYEGENDWIGIVTALEDVGYNGPWMYEVSFDAPNTICRRKLTCEDFKENYLCCVNKRPAPVIGTRS